MIRTTSPSQLPGVALQLQNSRRRLPGCQQQCASFIGDYNSFVYDADGTADIVWTDTKRFVKVRGVGEGYNENTFFAREDEDAG